MFMLSMSIMLLISLPVLADQSPNLGKPASSAIIEVWNQDIFIDGRGLPTGQGNVIDGEKLYQQYCLACHGVEGSGGSAEELAGAMHSLTDNPPDKIIGNYWPYATTLFDFVRRSMPIDQPGILNNNQLYAVTAYILYLNGLISRHKAVNAKTLSIIKMPNRLGFINVYRRSEKDD